jgi:lipopolysaccharide/colanic/teichoic acid biosynthesis glycosyltransferase
LERVLITESSRPRRESTQGDRRAYEIAKRTIDLAITSLALVLLSPAWAVIAVLVQATSPGPALFSRTVVGRGGRRFSYYKFRSMRQGDDTEHLEWLRDFVVNDKAYVGSEFKVRNDPRITPLGKLLRRTSLDEVPQLINVLRGEMSLVGPRPPIEFEYELYDDNARQRLAVKPGITGLYQVTARSAVPFSEMLRFDLEYIERRSVWLDFRIMLITPIRMITGRGAG